MDPMGNQGQSGNNDNSGATQPVTPPQVSDDSGAAVGGTQAQEPAATGAGAVFNPGMPNVAGPDENTNGDNSGQNNGGQTPPVV